MILVTLGFSYGRAVKGLGDITSNFTKFMADPTKFRCVLFTGGEDVDPARYNDKSPKQICGYSFSRDEFEFDVAKVAIANKIPMVGICRGLQLLNVVAGGRLMHHIENHAGRNHDMSTINGKCFKVNSLHHQMVVPPESGIVTAWSDKNLSNIYIGKNDEREEYTDKEIEAVIYPEIMGFGVQYHPEMMPCDTDGYKYFYNATESILSSKSFADFTTKMIGSHDKKQDSYIH